jgi:hypothetical protein
LDASLAEVRSAADRIDPLKSDRFLNALGPDDTGE